MLSAQSALVLLTFCWWRHNQLQSHVTSYCYAKIWSSFEKFITSGNLPWLFPSTVPAKRTINWLHINSLALIWPCSKKMCIESTCHWDVCNEVFHFMAIDRVITPWLIGHPWMCPTSALLSNELQWQDFEIMQLAMVLVLAAMKTYCITQKDHRVYELAHRIMLSLFRGVRALSRKLKDGLIPNVVHKINIGFPMAD